MKPHRFPIALLLFAGSILAGGCEDATVQPEIKQQPDVLSQMQVNLGTPPAEPVVATALDLVVLNGVPTVIDFEGLAQDEVVTNQYAALGVAFNGPHVSRSDGSLNPLIPPKSGLGVIYNVPATIEVALAPAVASVGGYVTGFVAVTLSCYDASDVLLGSDALASPNYLGASSGIDPNYFLHVDAAGIARCTFVSGDASANSFVVDDLTILPTPPEPPDLELTKSHVGTFFFGEENSWTLTVKNVGTGPTTGVIELKDYTSPDFDFVSAAGTDWTCDVDAVHVYCTNDGPLAAGAVTTVSVVVKPKVVGTIANESAVLTEGDPDLTNNLAGDKADVLAKTTALVSISPNPQQYSDTTEFKVTIKPAIAGEEKLSGEVVFFINLLKYSKVLPVECDYIADECTASVKYLVAKPAGTPIAVTASFVSLNKYFVGVKMSAPELLIILPERAAVTGFKGPIAVKVGTDGVEFSFRIQERKPDNGNGGWPAPGWIGNAKVKEAVLLPVTPTNGKISLSCEWKVVGDPKKRSYEDAIYGTCVPSQALKTVDTYELVLIIDVGGYYLGEYHDVFVVYDPDAGFVTGGGTYDLKGGDWVNFGLVAKYNKKGTQPQGSVLIIRHLSEGGVIRGKSNVLDGLTIVKNSATISGKMTYAVDGETLGNYLFGVWVEDNGTPGAGTDRVSVWLDKPLNLIGTWPTLTYLPLGAKYLVGGNIQVPQPSSGGGVIE